MELLDSVQDVHILDLGCGDGRFGLELFHKGCASFTGIEGSENMANEAVSVLDGHNATIRVQSLEEWTPLKERYNLVVSRMVFHYIEDLLPVFRNIYESLEEGGQCVFSVQHPVITSSIESAKESGQRSHWLVDDYFRQGAREEPWIDEEIVKYHRSIEQYIRLIHKAGFLLEGLREAEPVKGLFNEEEEFKRRQRIPLFLLLSCRKSKESLTSNK